MDQIFSFIFLIGISLPGFTQPDFKGFKKSDGGIMYKLHVDNKERNPVEGDYVRIHIINLTSADSVLFSTYEGNGNPVHFKLSAPSYNGDLAEVLQLMSQGDSATLYIPSDSFYRNNFMPKFTSKGDWIKYELLLVQVLTEQQFQEEKQLKRLGKINEDLQVIEAHLKAIGVENYVLKNNIYFVVEREGEGPNPASRQTVDVHYRGTLLNGSEFDSSYERNSPFSFQLGVGRVIEGWDLGIPLLKKGGKGTIYIPSSLGYGERGAGANIPPNTNLVFEVELVNISNKDNIINAETGNIIEYLNANGIKAKKAPVGFLFKIQEEGQPPNPTYGQTWTMDYSIITLDGTEIESTFDTDNPMIFTPGFSDEIEALDQGMYLFKKGTKATLFVQSPLAYGEEGNAEKGIAPNTTLIYDIHILDIK